MTQESPVAKVRRALEAAQAEGIAIEPDGTFDWVHGTWPNQWTESKPRAVNWYGAVVWVHRRDAQDFSFTRLKALLGVDLGWCYRFGYGFSQGRALSIIDGETMREVGKDDVSLAGARLAKEFWRLRGGLSLAPSPSVTILSTC